MSASVLILFAVLAAAFAALDGALLVLRTQIRIPAAVWPERIFNGRGAIAGSSFALVPLLVGLPAR